MASKHSCDNWIFTVAFKAFSQAEPACSADLKSYLYSHSHIECAESCRDAKLNFFAHSYEIWHGVQNLGI